MRTRKIADYSKAAAPLWVVTFADMMGLLLAFFILLASFSTVNSKKMNAAVGSIQQALGRGGALGGKGVMPQVLPVQEQKGRVSKAVEKAARDIRNRMQVLGLASGVDIKFDEQGGMLISLPSKILFDLGKADLKTDAYEVINQLGSSLSGIEGVFIEVRGHTDNIPLGPTSVFADNYDLSYHRAKNVMIQLTSPGGLAERACEVVACGPSQPVNDNSTEEGRQSNRRVELYVRGKASAETLEDLSGKLGGAQQQPAPPPAAEKKGIQ